MRKQTTAALVVAVIASTWAIPSVVQGVDLSAMEGTWSGVRGGGIQRTLRVLPVEEGRISGFMCVEYADGSTVAWGFSPEDEPGVVARLKFGVLEVRRDKSVYIFETPKPGQDRIRHRARNQGESKPFLKMRLRRTNSSTCADRLISRANAHLEPVAEREDSPLIGEWSSSGNGVIDEVQISDIGSWGRTRGVFCQVIWDGTAFRFWDLHDRCIGARRTRKDDKLVVTWKRRPAKWTLRYEKKYRFEVVPSGYGQSWAVQSWRYGKKGSEVTMIRGSSRARGCLARIRPSVDSGWTVRAPARTEDPHRGR